MQLQINDYLLYIEIVNLFFKFAARGVETPGADTSRLTL